MSPWGNPSQELVALSGLILAAVLLGWAILLVARHRRGPQMMTSQSFERGFDLLLEGRWEDAAESVDSGG